ncbi:MAG: UDP-N-acetylglucosamine 2-epimerase (non-hydrolyzing) [Acidobacteria bacterium]|uniref:UDP-N-acetylglucosamine 2-epimerase (Non-hydrolyzing) n=1 Tax=Candidatus Polarisedimenticola svalbardensis TaxID=2886004 RepID=A0A8J7C2N4_9BACT|nr:UDP-N-acetylglucosamine 2-epimerase (non-hydrolyzing) [Candidatus Polarisedimenticola svalbardensis]
MLKIINVVGARPNFMKIAPLIDAMNRFPDRIEHLLVHTGQHYDRKMSKAFFEDLGMPRPDIDLEVGSGTHAEQTGKVMMAFEKVCRDTAPDLVVVVGDVNSTMACTITAKKLGIRVAHVEAGLRSRDMAMPEEINRLCTDVLCDYLFTTDLLADRNLVQEGVPEEKIHFVGNVMIDTLLKHSERASKLPFPEGLDVTPGEYAVLTLHRPSNVDDRDTLEGVLEALHQVSERLPIVFPIHPRTEKMVRQFDLGHYLENAGAGRGFRLIEPIGYLDFLHLNMNAKMILTDSGGIQEEATVLGVPCITLRFNTERPITCEMGTNVLVGNRKEDILSAAGKVLADPDREYQVPDRWDGRAADRIVKILMDDDEQ